MTALCAVATVVSVTCSCARAAASAGGMPYQASCHIHSSPESAALSRNLTLAVAIRRHSRVSSSPTATTPRPRCCPVHKAFRTLRNSRRSFLSFADLRELDLTAPLTWSDIFGGKSCVYSHADTREQVRMSVALVQQFVNQRSGSPQAPTTRLEAEVLFVTRLGRLHVHFTHPTSLYSAPPDLLLAQQCRIDLRLKGMQAVVWHVTPTKAKTMIGAECADETFSDQEGSAQVAVWSAQVIATTAPHQKSTPYRSERIQRFRWKLPHIKVLAKSTRQHSNRSATQLAGRLLDK